MIIGLIIYLALSLVTTAVVMAAIITGARAEVELGLHEVSPPRRARAWSGRELRQERVGS